MEDGRYIVELSTPIEAHGETVTRLLIREPKVAHLRALDKVQGDVAQTAKLLSILSDVPLSSVDQLLLRDLKSRISPVLDALMGESQATGET
jgi:hypothetical protein